MTGFREHGAVANQLIVEVQAVNAALILFFLHCSRPFLYILVSSSQFRFFRTSARLALHCHLLLGDQVVSRFYSLY